jgi:hypothetical protein
MKNHSLILLHLYDIKNGEHNSNIFGGELRFKIEELKESDKAILRLKASSNELMRIAKRSVIKRGYMLSETFGCTYKSEIDGRKILVNIFNREDEYVILYYSENDEVYMAYIKDGNFRILNVTNPDIVKLCYNKD